MSQQTQGTSSGLGSPQSGQQQPAGFGVQQELAAGMIGTGATNGGGGLPQWQPEVDNMGLLPRQDVGLTQRGGALGSLGGGTSPSGLARDVAGPQGVAAALQEATWSLNKAAGHIEVLTSETGALRQALAEVTSQLSKMEAESREVRDRLQALRVQRGQVQVQQFGLLNWCQVTPTHVCQSCR